MSWRWVWLAAGLALLGLQSSMRGGIQARQEQAELVLPTADGASADLSVPVLALGAFRGLVVDYLWLRAETLRRNERYLEARQLNRQICRLQPRVWITWNHLAHDLAYNVSREHSSPEARWRWIQSGISVLRDDGLRFNPRQPQLYLRLSNVFEDKIGGYADDFHATYKRWYAQELHAVLGDASLDELAAAPPLSAHTDPATARLIASLADATSSPLDSILGSLGLDREALASTFGEREAEALLRARESPAWPLAVLAARAEGLRARYRLDPRIMLEVEDYWGKLDWRTCHSAAVYWAELGRQASLEQGMLWDAFQLERVALLALRNAMRRGRVVILDDGQVWLRPLPELALSLDRNYRHAIESLEAIERGLQARVDDPRGGGFDALSELEQEAKGNIGGHIENMKTTHHDQLVESISLLSDYGLTAAGKRLYAQGQVSYPEWVGWRESYEVCVERLQVMRYADSTQIFESHSSMTQYLEGCWIQGYRAIAFGEDEQFKIQRSRAQRAQRRWAAHVERMRRKNPRAAQRMGVPFEAIRKRAAFTAAQSLSPQLRKRLAERAGIPLEVLERKPVEVPGRPGAR